MLFFMDLVIFFNNLMHLLEPIGNICYLLLLMEFIVGFLFFIQSEEYVYDSQRFRFIL